MRPRSRGSSHAWPSLGHGGVHSRVREKMTSPIDRYDSQSRTGVIMWARATTMHMHTAHAAQLQHGATRRGAAGPQTTAARPQRHMQHGSTCVLCASIVVYSAHRSFRLPVSDRNADSGAGPMPSTVREPGAICVCPASACRPHTHAWLEHSR